MGAARFHIRISVTQSSTGSVTKKTRFRDGDRAVLFAQKWLLSTQYMANYFGITFGYWCVFELDGDGIETVFKSGGVTDAEQSRLLGSDKEWSAPMVSKRKPRTKPSGNAKGRKGDASSILIYGSAPKPGKATRGIASAKQLFLKRRIEEMRNRALADMAARQTSKGTSCLPFPSGQQSAQ